MTDIKENTNGQSESVDCNDIRNWKLRLFWIIPLLFLALTVKFEFPIENIGFSFLGGLLCGVCISAMICIKTFE